MNLVPVPFLLLFSIAGLSDAESDRNPVLIAVTERWKMHPPVWKKGGHFPRIWGKNNDLMRNWTIFRIEGEPGAVLEELQKTVRDDDRPKLIVQKKGQQESRTIEQLYWTPFCWQKGIFREQGTSGLYEYVACNQKMEMSPEGCTETVEKGKERMKKDNDAAVVVSSSTFTGFISAAEAKKQTGKRPNEAEEGEVKDANSGSEEEELSEGDQRRMCRYRLSCYEQRGFADLADKQRKKQQEQGKVLFAAKMAPPKTGEKHTMKQVAHMTVRDIERQEAVGRKKRELHERDGETVLEQRRTEKEKKVRCKYRKSCYQSGVVPPLEGSAIAKWWVESAGKGREVEQKSFEEMDERERKLFCRYRRSCYRRGERAQTDDREKGMVDLVFGVQEGVGMFWSRLAARHELDEEGELSEEQRREHRRKMEQRVGKLECKYRRSCYETGRLPLELRVVRVEDRSAVLGGKSVPTSVKELKLYCKYRKSCYVASAEAAQAGGTAEDAKIGDAVAQHNKTERMEKTVRETKKSMLNHPKEKEQVVVRIGDVEEEEAVSPPNGGEESAKEGPKRKPNRKRTRPNPAEETTTKDEEDAEKEKKVKEELEQKVAQEAVKTKAKVRKQKGAKKYAVVEKEGGKGEEEEKGEKEEPTEKAEEIKEEKEEKAENREEGEEASVVMQQKVLVAGESNEVSPKRRHKPRAAKNESTPAKAEGPKKRASPPAVKREEPKKAMVPAKKEAAPRERKTRRYKPEATPKVPKPIKVWAKRQSAPRRLTKLECRYRRSCYHSGIVPLWAQKRGQEAQQKWEMGALWTLVGFPGEDEDLKLVPIEGWERMSAREKQLRCKYRKSCYRQMMGAEEEEGEAEEEEEREEEGEEVEKSPAKPRQREEPFVEEKKAPQPAEWTHERRAVDLAIKLQCKYRKSCYGLSDAKEAVRTPASAPKAARPQVAVPTTINVSMPCNQWRLSCRQAMGLPIRERAPIGPNGKRLCRKKKPGDGETDTQR